MIVRGEMELQVEDDFVETLEARVANGTFLDPSVRYRVAEEPGELGDADNYRAPAPRRSFVATLTSAPKERLVATEVRLDVLPGRVRYEVHQRRGSLGPSIVLVVVQTGFVAVGFVHFELRWTVVAALAWVASIGLLAKQIGARRILEKKLQRFLRDAT